MPKFFYAQNSKIILAKDNTLVQKHLYANNSYLIKVPIKDLDKNTNMPILILLPKNQRTKNIFLCQNTNRPMQKTPIFRLYQLPNNANVLYRGASI